MADEDAMLEPEAAAELELLPDADADGAWLTLAEAEPLSLPLAELVADCEVTTGTDRRREDELASLDRSEGDTAHDNGHLSERCTHGAAAACRCLRGRGRGCRRTCDGLHISLNAQAGAQARKQ